MKKATHTPTICDEFKIRAKSRYYTVYQEDRVLILNHKEGFAQ